MSLNQLLSLLNLSTILAFIMLLGIFISLIINMLSLINTADAAYNYTDGYFIHLNKFAQHARKISQPYVNVNNYMSGGVWFQDHVAPSWNDFSWPAGCVYPSNDFSAMIYVTKLEPLGHYDNLNYVYLAFLSGEEKLFLSYFDGEYFYYFESTSLLFIVNDEATKEAAEEFVKRVQGRYPHLLIRYYQGVKMITVQNIASFDELQNIYELGLKQSAIKSAELSSFITHSPYEMDKAVYLGPGYLEDEVVFTEDLRTISDHYRQRNYLRTAPSFPKPFGEGPIERVVEPCPEM